MQIIKGRTRTKAALAIFGAVAVVGAAGATIAGATQSFGSVSVVLARGLVTEDSKVKTGAIQLKTKDPFEIVTQTVTFQPGGTSGWHSHPGPVFVAVKSGTVTVYDATCIPRRYSAGQGFLEGPEPSVVRNEGTVVSENLATLLVPAGSPARTDSPSLCPGIG
jgi:quercetin dioxygenase-like cupin family protein